MDAVPPHHVTAAAALLGAGQDHIFTKWASDTVDDERKEEFFQQVRFVALFPGPSQSASYLRFDVYEGHRNVLELCVKCAC